MYVLSQIHEFVVSTNKVTLISSKYYSMVNASVITMMYIIAVALYIELLIMFTSHLCFI